jgi:hypothetical protein
MVPSAPCPSARTHPTVVGVSDSPNTASKFAPQSVPNLRRPQPHRVAHHEARLVRFARERAGTDRDSVWSPSACSVRAYAVHASSSAPVLNPCQISRPSAAMRRMGRSRGGAALSFYSVDGCDRTHGRPAHAPPVVVRAISHGSVCRLSKSVRPFLISVAFNSTSAAAPRHHRPMRGPLPGLFGRRVTNDGLCGPLRDLCAPPSSDCDIHGENRYKTETTPRPNRHLTYSHGKFQPRVRPTYRQGAQV